MKGVVNMSRQRKWFYGIFGALFALILLFYGLILIFTYRGTLVKEEKLNKVYVAGHSLGGVVASLDAVKLQTENHLAGLILLASYPDKSVDFSSSNIPVLSIVASNDKILNWENYEASKSRLPKSSEELMIEGGNHSGFGMYGGQKGDGKASISNKEQQQKVIEKLTEFMKKTK